MQLDQENIGKEQKGQTIIEYILLMAAVIAFLLIFLSKGGFFEKSYNQVIVTQGIDMLNTAIRIFN
jgi:hypothetical protein